MPNEHSNATSEQATEQPTSDGKDPKKVAAGRKGGRTRWATPESERGNWKGPSLTGPKVGSLSAQGAALREGRPGRLPGIKPGSRRWTQGIGPKGSKWNPDKKRPCPGSAKSGCPKNQFFHVTLMSYKTIEKARNKRKGRLIPKSDPEYSPMPFTITEFRAEVLRQAISFSEPIYEDVRWMCRYTQDSFGLDEFACDHMIPRSRGGPDTLQNLLICRKVANKAKGALTAAEFEQILAPMRAWGDRSRMEATLRQWSAGASVQAQKMRMAIMKRFQVGGAA